MLFRPYRALYIGKRRLPFTPGLIPRNQERLAKRVVANLFGLRNTLTRLRAFCLDEKEATNERLTELIRSLAVRDRLKTWLRSISLQNLPVSTVRQLRKTTRDTIRGYVQTRGMDFLQGFNDSIDWDNTANLLLNRLRNSAALGSSLEVVSKELALLLERYLEKDFSASSLCCRVLNSGDTLCVPYRSNNTTDCNKPITNPNKPPKLTIACNSFLTIPSIAVSNSAADVDLTRSTITWSIDKIGIA